MSKNAQSEQEMGIALWSFPFLIVTWIQILGRLDNVDFDLFRKKSKIMKIPVDKTGTVCYHIKVD